MFEFQTGICKVSDVFVFPSLQEGLPVALLEAMACGLPVVGSNIRGNTDLIEDGVGGYLHQPNDVDGIAKSICALIENHSLRERISLRNISVAEQYDVRIIARSIFELYQDA